MYDNLIALLGISNGLSIRKEVVRILISGIIPDTNDTIDPIRSGSAIHNNPILLLGAVSNGAHVEIHSTAAIFIWASCPQRC